MKIHEYQGKQIFARHGIPVPKGYPGVQRRRKPRRAAKKLIDETGSPVVVVKAQIHAGGRGKGGGVKVVKGGAAEAKRAGREDPRHAARHAPDRPRGAEGAAALHRAGARDRARALPRHGRRPREAADRLMASTEGGVEIEKVAAETPEKILTEHVDPVIGLARLPGAQARLRPRARQGQPESERDREAVRATS